jgi:hypothetical protein
MSNLLVTFQDSEYTLAEAAILSQLWLSTSTFSDVFARPAVVSETLDYPGPQLQKVSIRRRGPEFLVEIHCSGQMPRSFLKSIEGVADLLRLPAGWNSYSAKPIAPSNAIAAIRLLAEMMGPRTSAPNIVPTVRGGIQLEWHTRGVNIEIYINDPEKVSFFAEQVGSGEICEEPLAGHEHQLKLWLERISGK